MASVTYGKSIMSSVIMAKILWQMKLSRREEEEVELPCQISHVFINSLICSGVYDE